MACLNERRLSGRRMPRRGESDRSFPWSAPAEDQASPIPIDGADLSLDLVTVALDVLVEVLFA